MVNNHHLAHAGLTPLRWIHSTMKFLSMNIDVFGGALSSGDELHWYHRVLFDATSTLFPQLFSA